MTTLPAIDALLWILGYTTRAISSVAILLVTWILLSCVYNALLHPLARVPGPWAASVSNIWLAWHVKNGRVAELGKTLHARYGPAVRVGPNEIWFSSKEAFRTIYSSGSGFEKSEFYLATALIRPLQVDGRLRVTWPDELDLLSEGDMKRYRVQRRLIGPVYRPNNVLRHEGSVDLVTKRVVKKLRSLQGNEIDLKEWMHLFVVECLGAVVVSWSPGMLDQESDRGTSVHAYNAWRRKSVLGLFPLVPKLESLSMSIGRAFSVVWGINFDAPPKFRPFFPAVGQKIGQRIKVMKQGQKDARTDIAADLVQLHQDRPEFTEAYLRKMTMTNFGAGHETMASTLTSLMTVLGEHPEIQQQLADELRQLNRYPSYNQADRTPILHAVLKESRRLYPVVSMALPRVVPASGARLHGYDIPAGTTVGCNPVALHRNPDVCGPDPASFEPSRWLGDEQRAKTMDMYSLGWGGGARSCPGRHLAEMMVWKMAVVLIREFEICVEAPAEEEMPSYFLSIMTGVKARFQRREQ
ncbi:Pisatin demethylase-like protein [Emericellopsis cladophorae]|uniref:Pisatin demethylase-like protein n=1 Tax=Emericellopsis cladophorae TaxID=2686198 RepID=A0A9P9XUY4_9HYPO|nr:Pisatin demethylase-like protein [Emericellopsis cladophorae]KAI6778287.1 Pisatin demethylase-like protein [Emericellopsis cladophorae]